MAERLAITVEPGAVTVVRCVGEIDISTGPILQQGLHAACAAEVDLIVDLMAISFMDSTGLNALVTAAKTCQHSGTRIGLAGVNPMILKLLTVTGLHKLLPVWDGVTEAEAALR